MTKEFSHYELSRSQWWFSLLSIVAACSLLVFATVRLVAGADVWQWEMLAACAGGIAAADFASGLVHWSADTWGRDDLPIVGRRLLVPFRVHHVNPDDFLRRRFVDTNGDVAFLAVPVLLGLNAVPLDTPWGSLLAAFGLGFCAIGIFTNQIHQWAHMASPPPLVRLLQHCGLLLQQTEHAEHHARPYDVRYCITTGWCNRPLEAVGFFRHLEAAITGLTGARPRHDDERYAERYGVIRADSSL